MDESAFFRDSSYRVNDKDIFDGASARVLPGGQTIVASTPWAESGLLYQLYEANWQKPTTSLVAHAPTLTLHDSEMTRALVASAYALDPDNARREFGAEFLKGGTVDFFEASSIKQAIKEDLEQPRTPRPGEIVAAGGDAGFRSDSSALAIVHLAGDRRIVGELLELRPEKDLPLKPSQTIAAFAECMKRHGASYMMADHHYRESVEEHLTSHGLAYSPAPGVPAEAYVRARMLFRQGVVDMPNNPRLVQQLREVKGRPMPGGGMSIIQPRWRTGGHGDLAAAFVLALYQLGGDLVQPPPPKQGTDQWEEKQRDERRAQVKARTERPWWKRR
jgi:hypothetical protein